MILEDLDKTYLGVMTLADSVEYRAGDRADVVVYMLGPMADRHNYLQLLGNTATLCAKADLLVELRKTTSAEQIEDALVECNRRARDNA